MRVRATRGIRITNFYGNYFIRGTDLLALPNCTADRCGGALHQFDVASEASSDNYIAVPPFLAPVAPTTPLLVLAGASQPSLDHPASPALRPHAPRQLLRVGHGVRRDHAQRAGDVATAQATDMIMIMIVSSPRLPQPSPVPLSSFSLSRR